MAGFYLAFFHDVFVEFIHYLWPTVYDGVGLVFGILTDAVTCKATHVVLLYIPWGFAFGVSHVLRWMALAVGSWGRDVLVWMKAQIAHELSGADD